MDDEALSLAVSHDGRFFATGGTAAIVKLWGYDNAELLYEGTGHSGPITGLRCVLPEKTLLAPPLPFSPLSIVFSMNLSRFPYPH